MEFYLTLKLRDLKKILKDYSFLKSSYLSRYICGINIFLFHIFLGSVFWSLARAARHLSLIRRLFRLDFRYRVFSRL